MHYNILDIDTQKKNEAEGNHHRNILEFCQGQLGLANTAMPHSTRFMENIELRVKFMFKFAKGENWFIHLLYYLILYDAGILQSIQNKTTCTKMRAYQ